MSTSKEPEEGKTQDQNNDMNMFASVWVKVEMTETPEENLWSPKASPKTPPMADVNPIEESQPSNKRKSRRPTKLIKCDMCDYETVYKNCMKAHKWGHVNAKPFTCVFCDYGTNYQTSLQRHIFIKHKDKCTDETKEIKSLERFQCTLCDYSTYFKWNLKCHLRKHKLEKQFKCPHCSYETAYRHNFMKHSRTHKDIEAFKCDKCPFVTKFKGHIHRHLAVIHNEVTDLANVCELCDFSTLEKWRLNMHKTRSRQETPIKCVYCCFETVFSCEYKKHKALHYSEFRNLKHGNTKQDSSALNLSNIQNNEENEPQTMQGENELSQSESVQQLECHPNILSSENLDQSESDNFNTSDLNQSHNLNTSDLNQSQNLNQSENYSQPDGHSQSNNYVVDPNCVDWNSIQVLESNDKDRPFQCIMCTYMSKFKASVQRHFQRHHTGNKNRPYKCVNCDFSTKTKDQISLHNKRSQSETVLYCSMCNFNTNYKCQFVMHQKSHYAYKCNLCDYTCKHKHELTKHFGSTHMGTGLKCQFCDYVTGRKDSLLSHETIHTNNKPFKCEYCDYTSIRKCLLDTHVKKFHRDRLSVKKIITAERIDALKIDLREPQFSGLDPDLDVQLQRMEAIVKGYIANANTDGNAMDLQSFSDLTEQNYEMKE